MNHNGLEASESVVLHTVLAEQIHSAFCRHVHRIFLSEEYTPGFVYRYRPRRRSLSSLASANHQQRLVLSSEHFDYPLRRHLRSVRQLGAFGYYVEVEYLCPVRLHW